MAEALLGFYGERSHEVAAELALLLEAARDFARAADYFLLAAQNAVRVFANQEAVVLAARGLELLGTLPDTPERARKELALQITLGPALMATKGWSAPEVERAYMRAHELCRQVGETPDLFPALWGLWLFHNSSRGDPDGAEPGRAAPQPGPAPRKTRRCSCRLITRWDRPMSSAGDWASAQMHLEQSIALYDPQQHRCTRLPLRRP